ncbi:MAG: hypothetical protein R2784_09115 [Saprospiraceae bacterium]
MKTLKVGTEKLQYHFKSGRGEVAEIWKFSFKKRADRLKTMAG